MARERSVSDVCEVLALGRSFRGELCLCISREICTVPSLYGPSTDGLILYYRDGAGRISRERRIKRFLTRRETVTGLANLTHGQFFAHRNPLWGHTYLCLSTRISSSSSSSLVNDLAPRWNE